MAMFYIYTIHNILNNKIYVGKTSNLAKRWQKHIRIATGKRQKEKFYIHRAIAKYGVDNFTFSVLQKFDTESECDLAETYWIEYFHSKDTKYGYNLTEGGEGVSGRIVSDATRHKQREKAVGRKHTEETLQSISGNNNHGSKLTSDEVKEIRYRYNILGHNLVILSKDYNVTSRTIARAIYNVDWYDENYVPPIPRKINNSGKPKLTLEKAKEIRRLRLLGVSLLELSKLFGVTKENISAIVTGKIWRDDD